MGTITMGSATATDSWDSLGPVVDAASGTRSVARVADAASSPDDEAITVRTLLPTPFDDKEPRCVAGPIDFPLEAPPPPDPRARVDRESDAERPTSDCHEGSSAWGGLDDLDMSPTSSLPDDADSNAIPYARDVRERFWCGDERDDTVDPISA